VNKLVLLPSPILEPQHTPLPLLVLSAGNVPLSPHTSAFLKPRPTLGLAWDLGLRHATYCWKAFNKSYNFVLYLTSIGGLNKKFWAFKVVKVSILRISGLPTLESWDKKTFEWKPRGQA